MPEPVEVVRELYAAVAAGDRVLVGSWADTMEGRPIRWWTVLTVRDGNVTKIQTAP
jgi:hypothetical protein